MRVATGLVITEIEQRYAELDQLLDRGIAACRAGDRDQALLLAGAVKQKLETLTHRLEVADLLDATRIHRRSADGH